MRPAVPLMRYSVDEHAAVAAVEADLCGAARSLRLICGPSKGMGFGLLFPSPLGLDRRSDHRCDDAEDGLVGAPEGDHSRVLDEEHALERPEGHHRHRQLALHLGEPGSGMSRPWSAPALS